MDQKTPKAKQPRQFTRDEVARMIIVTLDQVLSALSVGWIVQGIAVLPAGEDVYLVDLVMREVATEKTWAQAIPIPPLRERAEETEEENSYGLARLESNVRSSQY